MATEDKVEVLLKRGQAPAVLIATLTRDDARKLKIDIDSTLLGADLRLILQAKGLAHGSEFFMLQKATLRAESCTDGTCCVCLGKGRQDAKHFCTAILYRLRSRLGSSFYACGQP